MREIIEIDEDKCDGCGKCVPNCPEGALQIIDGKARLVSDAFCDGLGACVGHCPRGAIRVIKREAEEYDEKKVMEESIVPKGKNTIKAHLQHLKEHGAEKYLKEAEEFLKEQGIEVPPNKPQCPAAQNKAAGGSLNHWPVQLHLLNPAAPFLENSDLLLAADCTGYAVSDFHGRFLKDNSLAIACPKLDSGMNHYEEKLALMLEKVNSLTVAIMEVPCCSGLAKLAERAREKAGRDMQVKKYVIGINGEIKSEGWI